jgi:glucokinase
MSAPVLVADIGGTNARFALCELDGTTPQLREVRSLPCAEFGSLQHAAEAYLAAVGARPRAAGIAVACPVTGDAVRLTNRAWAFSQRELGQALGFDTLKVINDFGAVGWSVGALTLADCTTLHGPRAIPTQGPISVLGPGTGLGVALVVGSRERGWQVVETEGGHVSFAPIGDEEAQIARVMNARYGRTSNERLLCGAGIAQIEAALREVDLGEASDPAAVVEAALDGHDLLARRALARFCAVLGSVAGDTALIHGARTVLIAGGIVPRFIPFLESSAFRERFLAKGRFAAYLEGVGIHVITHPMPGLLGAAVALRSELSA